MEIDERNTKTLTLRDGPLEKLWGGGGNFRAAGIFFHLIFPCAIFFLPSAHPAPISFLMVLPLSYAVYKLVSAFFDNDNVLTGPLLSDCLVLAYSYNLPFSDAE